MKISAIRAYRVGLPLGKSRYAWSNENAVELFDSAVVAVETDGGTTDFNSYVTRSVAKGATQRKAGCVTAADRPGHGLEPRLEVLGRPALAVGA